MKKLLILLLTTILYSHTIFGQSEYCDTDEVEYIGNSTSFVQDIPLCNSTNQDSYNYAPDVVHYDHTPIKTLKLNFHFISDGSGNGNFNDTGDGQGGPTTSDNIATALCSLANYAMANNQQMLAPVGNSTPLIPDIRIRYEKGVVLSYDDGNFYDYEALIDPNYPYSLCDLALQEAINPAKEINVFLLQNGTLAPNSPTSSRRGRYKICNYPSIFVEDLNHGFHNGIYFDLVGWAGLLNHEIGHILGNTAGHPRNNCSGLTPANDDRSGFDCSDTPRNPCYSWSPETTNNVMNYAKTKSAWTPCQLGLWHWQIMKTWVNYIQPYYCNRDASQTITISTGEHLEWNSARFLHGDLIIESGASLKIRCLVGMPKYGEIIVKRGGKLILEGATLTNVCGDMWTGIELWGDPTKDQFPPYSSADQATLISYAGTTIEHAYDAITTGKYDPQTGFDYNYTGGGNFNIIGTTFRNCRRSIQMLNYHNVYNGSARGNISIIKNSDFILDADYNDPNVGSMHWVTLWEVEGVQFIDCRFKDIFNVKRNDPSDPNLITKKIKTHKAFKAVNSGFIFESVPGINNAEFDNFITGIESKAYQSLDFIKINKYSFTEVQYGIDIEGSISSQITNNIFKLPVSQINYYGILIQSCIGTLIEANDFSPSPNVSIWVPTGVRGIISEAGTIYPNRIYRNTFDRMLDLIRAHGKNHALLIQCNSMTLHANFSISVLNHNGDGTIAKNQGYCPGLGPWISGYDAGNIFGNQSGTKFSLMSNNLNLSVDYYHRNATGYVPYNPTGQFNLYQCGAINPCISTVPKTNGNGTGTGGSNSEIASKVDDLNDISSYIDQSSDQEEIEYGMLVYDQQYYEIVGDLLNRVDTIADSNQTVYLYNTDMTDIIGFMEDQESSTGQINPALIVAYLNDNDIINAQSELNEYKSSTENQLNSQGKILQILIDYKSNGILMNAVTADTEIELRDIQQDNPEKGFESAQALLWLNFNDEFPRWNNPLDSSGARIGKPINEQSTTVNKFLKCNPNPFNGKFEISVLASDSLTNYKIVINSIQGDIIYEEEMYSKKEAQVMIINGSQFNNGLYICSLHANGRILESIKIIKK